MSIEIGSLFGGVYNKAYSVKGLNIIFSNIIYTSIILSCIVLIIIMFIYPCKSNAPSWLLLKMFAYILFSSVIFLSIHSSILKNNYEKKYTDSNMTKLYDKFKNNNLIYGDEIIKPKLNMSSNPVQEEGTITGGNNYHPVDDADDVDTLLDKLSNEI